MENVAPDLHLPPELSAQIAHVAQARGMDAVLIVHRALERELKRLDQLERLRRRHRIARAFPELAD